MAGYFAEDRDENERTWEQLLDAVAVESCIPFLGAGACYPDLPLGGQLAERLAAAVGYPADDRGDLLRVAQYAAVTRAPIWVKRWVVTELKKVKPPAERPADLTPDEPHAVLAGLALPLYVTTNYDQFMVAALTAARRKPQRELCRWNRLLTHEPSALSAAAGFTLHPATPVVYHLHGHLDKPESMVLTEDDYLDFLEEMIRRGDELLPEPVAERLRLDALLFIGYSLRDWNFRLLLRSLKAYMVAANFLVLKPPEGATAQAMRKYLEEFYGAMRLSVYWGTAREFCGELRRRRDERQKAAGTP